MEFDLSAIAEFCQKHHIIRMSAYVNPSRSAAERERVMDFLVDFEPGHAPGYFDMFGGPGLIGMEEELAEMLGKEQIILMTSTGMPSGRKKALSGALSKAEHLYPALEKA